MGVLKSFDTFFFR